MPNTRAFMTETASEFSIRKLSTQKGWIILLSYAFAAFSTFSIVGMDLTMFMLTLLVLAHLRREPSFKGVPAWVYLPLLLFPLLAFFATAVSADGIQPVLIALLKHFRLYYPFLFLVILSVVDLRRLLRVHVAFVILMGAYAIIQYYWGVDWLRPEGAKEVTPYLGGRFHGKGNFSHHLTFAGVMLMTVPVYASLALPFRGKESWYWAAGAVFGALGVLLSMGRSGWIGVFFGVMVLVLRLPRRWAVTLIGLGVTFVLVTGVLLQSGWLSEQLAGKTDSALLSRMLDTSVSKRDKIRIVLWTAALEGIRDRPVLGHGYQAKRFDPYRERVAKRENFNFFGSKFNVHNIYLQVAFYFGVIGLLGYLAIWGSIFWWNAGSIRLANPKKNPFHSALAWGIAGGLTGSMVEGFFENQFFDKEVQVNILMWMGIALYIGIHLRKHQP